MLGGRGRKGRARVPRVRREGEDHGKGSSQGQGSLSARARVRGDGNARRDVGRWRGRPAIARVFRRHDARYACRQSRAPSYRRRRLSPRFRGGWVLRDGERSARMPRAGRPPHRVHARPAVLGGRAAADRAGDARLGRGERRTRALRAGRAGPRHREARPRRRAPAVGFRTGPTTSRSRRATASGSWRRSSTTRASTAPSRSTSSGITWASGTSRTRPRPTCTARSTTPPSSSGSTPCCRSATPWPFARRVAASAVSERVSRSTRARGG